MFSSNFSAPASMAILIVEENFKIKTYLFLVYDSQEFCQFAEWQTSMAPSHHTNLFL
jgi:hypothetical protein